MKLVLISDTHTNHKMIDIPECDILIHAGDITFRGELDMIEDFSIWMQELPARYKICIHGNHELGHENGPKRALGLKMLSDAGIIYLQDSGIDIEGIKIWGSAITPYFFAWEYNRQRGEDIAYHWKMIPDDTNVLVTHGPPYSILDKAPRGFDQFENVGCVDLLNRIGELKKLKVHVFGHIHADYGQVELNGVKYINASVCNEKYEAVNKPVVIEI
jgi:Icc-related predicted phosphoesterase